MILAQRPICIHHTHCKYLYEDTALTVPYLHTHMPPATSSTKYQIGVLWTSWGKRMEEANEWSISLSSKTKMPICVLASPYWDETVPSEKDRESVNINIEKDSTQQDTPPKALITLFVSGMRAIIQRGDGYMVSMVWMEGGAFHSSLILVCWNIERVLEEPRTYNGEIGTAVNKTYNTEYGVIQIIHWDNNNQWHNDSNTTTSCFVLMRMVSGFRNRVLEL